MSDNISLSAADETCPAVTYQKASVCVPVQVTPYARTGAVITECCGAPTVTPGIQTCPGSKNGSCYFTVSQEICIAVPVAFGAVATVVNTYVKASESAEQDICISCQDK